MYFYNDNKLRLVQIVGKYSRNQEKNREFHTKIKLIVNIFIKFRILELDMFIRYYILIVI